MSSHALLFKNVIILSQTIRELMMASKQKCWGVGTKGSGGMRFFDLLAALYEKYGEPVFYQDCVDNSTIIGKYRQVFSCHLRETSGYEYTHPNFPGTTFPGAKKNFLVSERVNCCLIMRL